MSEEEIKEQEQELEEEVVEEPEEEPAEPEGKPEEKPDEEKEPEQPLDIDSLKAELAELRNANQGLLRAVQEERRKRQEHDGRLSQITELLAQAKSRTDPEKPEKEKLPNIPVEIGDDGEAYIRPDVLQEFLKRNLKTVEEPVKEIREELEQTRAAYEQERAFNQIVNEVISRDESYPTAYTQLQKAASWVNEQVKAMQEAADLTGYVPTQVALEALAGSAVEEEFHKLFPGADFERTIRAFDSKYDLMRAVDSFAKSTKKDKLTLDPQKAKKTMSKPSNLGSARGGTKGGIEVETLETLSPEDIENLTPQEREKLLRILEKNDI